MGVWVVCADKGSPGASTLALLLAATHPEGPILVEADLAGGDVGPRLFAATGRPHASGANLLALASAARHSGADPALVGAHAAMTAAGVPLVAGLAIADQQTGLAPLWPVLAGVLAASERPVVVDIGRIWSGHPALAVAAAAEQVVVAVRPSLEEMLRLRDRVHQLLVVLGGGCGARLSVAVVAPEKTAARDQAAVTKLLADTGVAGVRVGWICLQPKELADFYRGSPNRRSSLWQSAQAMAGGLGAVASATAAQPTPAPGHRLAGEAAWTIS